MDSNPHICKYFNRSKTGMNRILCSLILLFTMMAAYAQDISISPYSAFNYGDRRLDNGATTFGMAGLSTSYISPFGTESNFMNPASNQNLRLTNFTFEGSMDMTRFKSQNEDFSRSATYISRVSLGFPLGEKWRAGFGFQPFSALGYRVANYNYTPEGSINSRFAGEGGLNTLQFMLSRNLTPELALGIRSNYIFGRLDKSEVLSGSNIQLATSYVNKNDINGFAFTTGISYYKKQENSKFLSAGATYGLGSNIKANQNYLVKTYQVHPTSYNEYNVDTIQYLTSDRKVRIPENASLGISYGKDLKWALGAQIDWEKNSAFILQFDEQQSNDRLRVAAGGYYIPQFNSFRSYFARATYRGGVFYEKTPIQVQGQDIQDYGITFGIGLPVGKVNNPSELNLGVELGQRGTTNSDLVKETFANVKLSFTLNDSWFQRRKYD
ncbi:MAG: hypothetical protein Q4G27_05770 [Flavobacteriaceae bacterium]|nr:hypothetical protein [Flavobacteriaceae bacterium]